MKDSLRAKISSLPDSPGVYIFKDRSGKVIYVGKAKSLKARLKSYLTPSEGISPRVEAIIRQVDDLDFIVTASEVEALILECAQIKHFKPRYNVRLKDDKKYPYIKVTIDEPFPSVYPTRNLVKDGSRYFGPYTDAKAMRKTLGFLSQIFRMRTCRKRLPLTTPDRGCLKFFIGRCVGACRGQVDEQAYRRIIDGVCEFLSGRVGNLIKDLRQKMESASAEKRFEQAAALRDMIKALEKVSEQQVVMSDSSVDKDVVAVRRKGRLAIGVVLRIREGKLLSKEVHKIGFDGEPSENEILSSFLEQYFAIADPLPSEVLVEHLPEEAPLIEDLLTTKLSRRVKLSCPKKGKSRKLVDLAIKNAEVILEQSVLSSESRIFHRSLSELARWLGLESPPRLIMAFDISTLQGWDSVGARVAFKDGRPFKQLYRRYSIKGVKGQDDFAMIEEVVSRAWSHIRAGEEPMPDLIIVDGGKGQVSSALKVLAQSKQSSESLPKVIGIAKPIDQIWFAEKPEPLQIPHDSPALHLLVRIRDEVHRFAIGYHRNKRESRLRSSLLERIPGVGRVLSLRLLERFGSVDEIRKRTAEEIASVPGIGISRAEKILSYMRGEANKQ